MKRIFLTFIVAALVAASGADASAQCCRLFSGWGRCFASRSYCAGGTYSGRSCATTTAPNCAGGVCETTTAPNCAGGVCETTTAPNCAGGVCEIGTTGANCVGGVCEIGAAKTTVALATPGSLEAEILAVANAERANRGLAPLQFDDEREAGARQVAQWNAARNVCRHYGNFPGEICANAPTARGAVNAWIGSPKHFAHLFSDGYNRVSIGVATRNDLYGGVYRYYTFRLFYRAEDKTK